MVDLEPRTTELTALAHSPVEITNLNRALTAATETVLRTWAANGVPGAVEELARRDVRVAP